MEQGAEAKPWLIAGGRTGFVQSRAAGGWERSRPGRAREVTPRAPLLSPSQPGGLVLGDTPGMGRGPRQGIMDGEKRSPREGAPISVEPPRSSRL